MRKMVFDEERAMQCAWLQFGCHLPAGRRGAGWARTWPCETRQEPLQHLELAGNLPSAPACHVSKRSCQPGGKAVRPWPLWAIAGWRALPGLRRIWASEPVQVIIYLFPRNHYDRLQPYASPEAAWRFQNDWHGRNRVGRSVQVLGVPLESIYLKSSSESVLVERSTNQ